MAVKQIDCYGFETTSEFFRIKKLDTHLVKMKDGVMYMCFGDERNVQYGGWCLLFYKIATIKMIFMVDLCRWSVVISNVIGPPI